MLVKGAIIHQEEITIINLYAYIVGASTSLTYTTGHKNTDKPQKSGVEDVNTPLSPTDS
jgi:hypothetical protein